jgi:methionine sulfoxide reductase heme-binding subunit
VGITSSTALWYASRATGVVALVLLTAVVVLGVLVNRRGRLPGLPRFATTSLHRSVSLLAVVFLAVHVLTAIADPYVTIGIVAAIVPFTAAYKTFWIGLGAVSLDIVIALIVTSLARARLGRRAWRAVHWLAYAAWPIALFHSLGSSTDLRSGGLLTLTILCTIAVVAATGWRVASAAGDPGRVDRAARALAASGRRQPGDVSTGDGAHGTPERPLSGAGVR